MSKTVPFQTIQFSISTQFKCTYTFYLSKIFLFQAIRLSQTVLIQTIQFSVSIDSMSKAVLFQVIQFSISTQFSFIWPIDRALSGATTPCQSGPGSNGHEEVLHLLLPSFLLNIFLLFCIDSFSLLYTLPFRFSSQLSACFFFFLSTINFSFFLSFFILFV